jgi:hypothetical protein
MTLHEAQAIIVSICDGLLIQADDDNSLDLHGIAIDLTDRAVNASNRKELIIAIEIADADLEQLGGLDETIEALRNVAKEIAA